MKQVIRSAKYSETKPETNLHIKYATLKRCIIRNRKAAFTGFQQLNNDKTEKVHCKLLKRLKYFVTAIHKDHIFFGSLHKTESNTHKYDNIYPKYFTTRYSNSLLLIF